MKQQSLRAPHAPIFSFICQISTNRILTSDFCGGVCLQPELFIGFYIFNKQWRIRGNYSGSNPVYLAVSSPGATFLAACISKKPVEVGVDFHLGYFARHL
jgi:hypothetical protein